MTKVRVKNVKSVKVKIEPEVKVYAKVPLYLRPHKLHEHEDASDLAVSTEGQLIRKSGNNWVAFTPEYYEDKNRTPGAVLFAGADGKISEDSPHFFYKSTEKFLGLGIDPRFQFHLSRPNGQGSVIFLESDFAQPNQIKGIRNRGNSSAPLPPLAVSSQLEIGTASWDGTIFSNARRTGIRWLTSEDWSSTGNGAGIVFETVPTGTLTNIGRLLITNGGTIIAKNAYTISDFTSNFSSKLIVWGQGTNLLTYTAQFHNFSGISNTLVIRDDIRVGVAQLNPQETFHVSGNIRIGLSANNGYYIDWGQDAVGTSGSFARIQGVRTDASGNQAGDLVFYTKERATGGVTPPERWRLFENGRSRYQLVATVTENNSYGWNFTGTLTARAVTGDALFATLINPTLIATESSQQLIGQLISPSYSFGAFGITSRAIAQRVNLGPAQGNTIESGHISNVSLAEGQWSFRAYINNSLNDTDFGIGLVGGASGYSALQSLQTNTSFSSRYLALQPLGGNVSIGFAGTLNARVHVRGAAVLTGNAFQVDNNSPVELFRISNNLAAYFGAPGLSGTQEVVLGSNSLPWTLRVGGIGSSLFIYQTGSDPSVQNAANQDGYFIGGRTTTNSAYSRLWLGFIPGTGFNATSGQSNAVTISGDALATSGNNSVNILRIIGNINQTGGANGVTRGILISQTLTSAFDYRAIEVTIGRSMFRNIEVQNGDTISFGSPNTDGTWRFIRNGNDLIIQRRESGVYNTKQTIAA